VNLANPILTPKINVIRHLSNGESISVGVLAQNKQGVYFQYDNSYLNSQKNLSPFKLKFTNELQLAPKTPHNKLHGVFSDSLPDGWGLLLQDREFKKRGLQPNQITAMDRLSLVGNTGVGALSYQPACNEQNEINPKLDLHILGLEAQAVFNGQTEELTQALLTAGSSAGARPKAQLYFAPGDFSKCRTQPTKGDEAWLVKFTSENLPLKHEEGLCEAAYLTMAKLAKIDTPEWQLIPAPKTSGASHWLALKRFDRQQTPGGQLGKMHMHSAAGLLDADFRMPSLDYQEIIKASRVLCQSPKTGQIQFARAIFNLLSCNQDDHAKNWSFLQTDDGNWNPSPFYDITYSPTAFNEHSTAFIGYGKQPPLKVIQQLATDASFSNWQEAKEVIENITDAISQFTNTAQSLGIQKKTIHQIQNQLNKTWKENSQILGLPH